VAENVSSGYLVLADISRRPQAAMARLFGRPQAATTRLFGRPQAATARLFGRRAQSALRGNFDALVAPVQANAPRGTGTLGGS
jgi:hypothetical protein